MNEPSAGAWFAVYCMLVCIAFGYAFVGAMVPAIEHAALTIMAMYEFGKAARESRS